jgi:hypothetical protein
VIFLDVRMKVHVQYMNTCVRTSMLTGQESPSAPLEATDTKIGWSVRCGVCGEWEGIMMSKGGWCRVL